jgi:hypothetical protein
MGRFIIKHIDNRKPQVKAYPSVSTESVVNEDKKKTIEENKEEIKEVVMTTSEKIAMAQSVLNAPEVPQAPVKRVKRDKGLIERTESSKTVLTEDNKELLND